MDKVIVVKPVLSEIQKGIFSVRKYYSCPNCENAFLRKEIVDRNRINYCWDCGCKLDWDGVE